MKFEGPQFPTTVCAYSGRSKAGGGTVLRDLVMNRSREKLSCSAQVSGYASRVDRAAC